MKPLRTLPAPSQGRNARLAAVALAGCVLLSMMTAVPATVPRAQAAVQIAEYVLPAASSQPFGLTRGPDGNLWYVSDTRVGRVQMDAAHTITQFGAVGSGLTQAAFGPDGALWYTEFTTNSIGRCTTDGATSQPVTLAALSRPWGITVGPDGAIWFTERDAARVGRIPATAPHTLTEIPIPGSFPTGITRGPDGNLWVADSGTNSILRISPTAPYTVTPFAIPTPGSDPTDIDVGADGNLWFTERFGDRVARLTPAGAFTEFPVPTAGAGPFGISPGPDGALWFTGQFGQMVGRCTTNGVITEYATPTTPSGPTAIAAGPDGAVWFTEFGADRLGHVTGLPFDTWYLPEGSTAWGFDSTIAIENPNPTPVTARVTYMTSTGPVAGGDIPLVANSTLTVIPLLVLGQADFSTKVECLEGQSIAVERLMTWTPGGAPMVMAGHSSIGVTAPAPIWYLPEGSSAWGFECWLLIQNPTASEATCQVTYMIEGEAPQVFSKTVPANSRRTYSMADDIGAKDASIRVQSNTPVIPERAMYRNERREGHDSIGTPGAATDYYLAEGSTAWGFTEYVLVQNPNSTATDVDVTYMTDTGPVPKATFTMPANSRETIRVNDDLPDRDLSTRVHGTQGIIAERAMYWDNGTGEAAHDSIGMAVPHTAFRLPFGGCGGLESRETWTLVQNPETVDVQVEVSYLTDTGLGNITFTDTVPAGSRRTYDMSDRMPLGTFAGVTVRCLTAGRRIMSEKALYWLQRSEGADSIGGFED
ncbi:MAG: DUF5719 family protein [Actinomycetota bacterium]